jgi:prolyl-tRNA synthetase
MSKKITKRSEDYSRWYTDVIAQAELADYSPVKGCMVIRPYGYAIWENIRDALDRMIKETGHENAYFPLFIPESFLAKESEHVEGFAPQCAVVTHGGGKRLEENLYIRPTSETIIYTMYAKWVQSWRDLPILINQWANVVRWEMRTRLFLRTTEFLWQEGHTAHASYEEAEEETMQMLYVYKRLSEKYMAIPVIEGRKSESEKFAGAHTTYTIEAMMQDRKALQAGTSHNLGQNFSKAFDLTFQSKDGKIEYAWNTSWGVSTRLVGGLIMAHGDDRGIVVPPRIAPIQIVIIPIWKTAEEQEKVVKASEALWNRLRPQFRVKVDRREHLTPGWKFYEYEKKGIPVRVEVGPRDLQQDQVTICRRDTLERSTMSREGFPEKAPDLLKEIQKSLFDRALTFQESNTFAVDGYDEFKSVLDDRGGFLRCHWCGEAACEAAVQDETKATIRCIPFGEAEEDGRCIVCGKPSKKRVIFAKAY